MPFSDFEISKLKQIPQEQTVWEVVKLPASRIMKNPPNDVTQADVIIWGDLNGESIRNMQFVGQEQNEDVASSLATAIMGINKSISPARPQKVLVRDKRLLFYCRGMLRNLNIECEFAGGRSIFDRIIKELGQELSQFEPLSDLDFAPLEETSRVLWQMAPWKYICETEVVKIEFQDRPDMKLYAVTVGGGIGVHLGVLFFRDREKIRRLFHTEKSMTVEEQAANFENCYSVTFDVDPTEKSAGASASPDMDEMPHLSIAVVDNNVDLRPLQDKPEFHLVHAALQAYLQFVQKYREGFEKSGTVPQNVSMAVECPELAERGLSRVTMGIEYLNIDLASAFENVGVEGVTDVTANEQIPVLTNEAISIELPPPPAPELLIEDLRAGAFDLSIESVEKQWLCELPATKAFFSPGRIGTLAEKIGVVRMHLPKRRAMKIAAILGDCRLHEFFQLTIDSTETDTVISVSDGTRKLILGSLVDARVESDLIKAFKDSNARKRPFILSITSGAPRPGTEDMVVANINAVILCRMNQISETPRK